VLLIFFLYGGLQAAALRLTDINDKNRTAYTKASEIFFDAHYTGFKDGRAMHGVFCGTVNLTIPWTEVNLYSGRIAVLFDLDKKHFTFRVNGDKHVGLCKENPLDIKKENDVIVSATPYTGAGFDAPLGMKGITRSGMKPCLKQELDDGATLTFHPKDTDTVHAELVGVGLLARLGGKVDVDLTRKACEIDYKDDGGQIPYEVERKLKYPYSYDRSKGAPPTLSNTKTEL
jgi:hypothetical protein